MSPQDIIDFCKEYGNILIETPFAFITFGFLCITVTAIILGWLHKKSEAKLQEKINQMKADAEEHQQEVDTLKQENLSLSEEIKRLKKQFEDLTIEGYIVASREVPKGIAAEKISKQLQVED